MTKETDDLLHHAEVIKIVRAVLMSTGIRGDALDDGVQEALLRAWKVLPHPDALDGWKKLSRKVAKAYGIDELRKRKTIRHEQQDAGLTDNADLHAANANHRPRWEERDARKALDVLYVMIDDGLLPPDFDAYLDAVQAGESHEDIAKAAGVPLERWRNALWRGRKKIMARYAAVGLGTLAVVGALYGAFVYADPYSVAHHHDTPNTIPDAGPASTGGVREELPPSIPVDTHKAEIDDIRLKIADAVTNKRWEKCVGWYQQLRPLLPDGGATQDDPVRTQCETEYMRSLNSKSGPEGGAPRQRKPKAP